uniref:Putative secreted protein n=1 Tax=Anopheles darlingi TaxID=43151 RepID=A0A2M4DPJ6_ANODA
MHSGGFVICIICLLHLSNSFSLPMLMPLGNCRATASASKPLLTALHRILSYTSVVRNDSGSHIDWMFCYRKQKGIVKGMNGKKETKPAVAYLYPCAFMLYRMFRFPKDSISYGMSYS